MLSLVYITLFLFVCPKSPLVSFTLSLTPSLLSFRVLPNSARWLLVNNRKEEALVLLRKAATMNGRPLPTTVQVWQTISHIHSLCCCLFQLQMSCTKKLQWLNSSLNISMTTGLNPSRQLANQAAIVPCKWQIESSRLPRQLWHHLSTGSELSPRGPHLGVMWDAKTNYGNRICA